MFLQNLQRKAAHFCKALADLYGSSRFSAMIFEEPCIKTPADLHKFAKIENLGSLLHFLNEKVSNRHQKWHKSQSFSSFEDFMHFFQNFDKDFEDWIVKNDQQETNVLGSGLFLRISRRFHVKMSQIDTKNYKKNPKISLFLKTLCIFSKLSTYFVDWNVRKSQQGKIVSSFTLFWRIFTEPNNDE